MKLDLLDLVRADETARAQIESYGINPEAVETWLQDQRKTYRDPTADEAIYRADRDLAKRRARSTP